jgi:ABC-type bacteriocin/lantibiotic exporter with double-glycine peptidase domain
MNLLFDIWGVLTARQRQWVVLAQVLSIVMAISTMAGIASIAPFFSVLGSPQSIDHSRLLHWLYIHLNFSSRGSFEVALGLAFMTLVLVANLINVFGSFMMIRLAWWIGTDLQCILFGEYLARPYVFHARTHSAVLVNNIIHETARATNEILQNVFLLITNIVTATFIILSVMLLNPAVGTAMILSLAGGYVLIYLAVRKRLFRAGQFQSHFFVEQTKIVNESLGAIKEILVLRLQNFFRGDFARSSQAFARATAHTQLIGQAPRHVMECVAVAVLVPVALLGGGREGGIGPWLGQLTFLGFAAYRLLPTLQQAFAATVRIRACRAGFASIATDLRLARARKYSVRAADSSWQERPRREIQLREVSFRYEPDRPPAASGVSLRIPARAAVGLVGANGSGKTTLVDLVAGLLVPVTGKIEVDGITLDDANRAAWQSRIAYVPQNISLLDTTIARNIALGIPTAAIDQERLLAASQLAQLDEFVRTLPRGYHHPVGERGMSLSGGQRQRIGIARALYTDASVLIMDEATNAMDGLTEQELMATILRLRGRYTIILIAHRLSAVRACDVIFELDGGKVTASGTFAELLGKSETFRRLVNVS